MIENKRIDILMATYNGEKYLVEQLDSIINQTYRNWNLLIRDDNSTDKTLEIIQNYHKKDKRIKILKDNKGNLGIVRNFEELLKSSESEFIMFSDQDDIWVENKLDMYLKMIEKIKNKGFMIHSDAILFDKNKSNILKDTFISKKAINSLKYEFNKEYFKLKFLNLINFQRIRVYCFISTLPFLQIFICLY